MKLIKKNNQRQLKKKHVRKCLSRVQIAANFSLFCKQTAKRQMPKQCHLAISSRMTGVAMCLALGAEPLLDQEGGEKKNERKYTHTHTHTPQYF
jgi:hypothetical protein